MCLWWFLAQVLIAFTCLTFMSLCHTPSCPKNVFGLPGASVVPVGAVLLLLLFLVSGYSLMLFVRLHLRPLGAVCCVTKRRSSWACIGNPNPEQETIEGTHAQETPAYQRRPTTLHAVQGSNPPIRALYMQLAKIPHTQQTTPCATPCARHNRHVSL